LRGADLLTLVRRAWLEMYTRTRAADAAHRAATSPANCITMTPPATIGGRQDPPPAERLSQISVPIAAAKMTLVSRSAAISTIAPGSGR